jgi:4-hydroxybenzoate polyprenyltransferase
LRETLRLPTEQPAADTAVSHNRLRHIVRALRPQQWIKNGFVFLGMVFSGDWRDFGMLWRVLLAAMAFCLLSSAVYLFNDLLDREQDRLHPVKRLRPIAAGLVTPKLAGGLIALLSGGGLWLGYLVSPACALILLAYLAQNLAYSKGLKRVVLLDVFIIALGFMLRILAGTWGVGIAPSNWLLLCGLLLTLFIGFGKRWAELADVADQPGSFRPVLVNYNRELLNQFTGICAGGAIVTYGLYTLDPSTVALHQTSNLIYTMPLVIYGIFRYLYLIHSGAGGDPSKLVVKDLHIAVTVLLWLAMVVLILK